MSHYLTYTWAFFGLLPEHTLDHLIHFFAKTVGQRLHLILLDIFEKFFQLAF